MPSRDGPARDEAAHQHEVWNGGGGRGWVLAQDLLDRMFRPLEDLLVEAVEAASARRVLDVGCGTGATTVALARRLPADGACIGIDLSDTMIEAARARADRAGVAAHFIRADAETHAFEPGAVDAIVSRFGVMFFADPVRAFVNLRGAVSGPGALCCLTWRSASENPFMTAAEEAAEPLLPGVARRAQNEPGQFGLADSSMVRDILTASGWSGIDVAPLDVPCTFPASALDRYLGNLGPVGRALQNADASTRQQVIEAVRPAFAPYVDGDDVRFTAACWRITAAAAGGARR